MKMFSGDSSGEGLLNHFAQYQMHAATSGGAGIDWATLAQQWIQMRDCVPATTIASQNVADYSYSDVPPPPPPPTIGNYDASLSIGANELRKTEEKGEADMDMDDDDVEDGFADLSTKAGDATPPATPSVPVNTGLTSKWFPSNLNVNGALVSDSISAGDVGLWNNWQGSSSSTKPNQATSRVSTSTSHIPSLLNLNIINPNEVNDLSGNRPTNDLPNSGVDAAKRKILPAWIREGLEKMEREKQKQLEREKQETERKTNRWDSDGDDNNDGDNKKILLKKSKSLVNDLSNNNEEDYSSGNDEATPSTLNKRNLVNYKAESADESDHDLSEPRPCSQTPSKLYKKPKTFEEKLNDLMIAVRRNLTELLLEVTDKEIAIVVQETIRAQRLKASSAQVIRKSAISSITGKLGLAAYADSSDSESGSEDDSDNDKRSSNYDSEEDLKQTIRLKRRAFAKIADDIERRVNAAAEKEEERLQHYRNLERGKEKDLLKSNGRESSEESKIKDKSSDTSISKYGKFGKTFNKDFGEASVSKLHHLNGKHHSHNRKERTTRFSDNKDGKSVSAVAAAALVAATNYSSSKTNQRPQPIQNPATALLQMPPTSTSNDDLLNQLSKSKNSGDIHNMLNAADEAIEKASKGGKSSSSNSYYDGQRRRRSYSTDEDRKNRRKRRRDRSKSSLSSSPSSSDSRDTRSSKNSQTSSEKRRIRRDSKERHTSISSNSRHYRDHRKVYSSSSTATKRTSGGDRYKDDYYYSNKRSSNNYSSDSDNDDRDDYYRKSKSNKSSKSSKSYKYSSSKSSSKRYRQTSRSRSRSRSRSHTPSRTRSRSQSTKKKSSRSRSRSHSYSSSTKHRSRR